MDLDEAKAALADPTALLDTIREQVEQPLLSTVDDEPVLFQERAPARADKRYVA